MSFFLLLLFPNHGLVTKLVSVITSATSTVLFPTSTSTMFTILCPSSYELPQTGLPTNSHPTATSTEQSETEQLIADLLSLTGPDGSSDDINARAAITLRKQEHNVFLASTLFRLPAGFVMLDASKPWLLFWTAHSLDLLGIALDQGTKNR